MEKHAYMTAQFDESDLEMMVGLRAQIAPKKIASPGKMLSEGEPPALNLHGIHPLEKKGVISRE